jgi:hypothetical protein
MQRFSAPKKVAGLATSSQKGQMGTFLTYLKKVEICP